MCYLIFGVTTPQIKFILCLIFFQLYAKFKFYISMLQIHFYALPLINQGKCMMKIEQ